VMSSGGESLATNVLAGGLQYVLSGGTASGTSVINAGNEQILSGGTAVSTTVSGGGFLVVSAGGTINGATIAGATMEIQSGGLTGANPITYSGGAALVLDASANFNGTIANFKTGDFLDLKDIAFGSSTSMNFVEAGNNLSGTLSVTDGSHTAHITLLGSYTPSQFTSASDGHGGTVITDPPVSAALTADATDLLWQPATLDAARGASSMAASGGNSALQLQGPTVATADAANLLWRPAGSLSSADVMAGGSSQGQPGLACWLVMHQPALGS